MTKSKQTIVLTSADDRLVAQLRSRHPSLDIIIFGGQVESLPPGIHIWAFVDWLLPDMSGLEICRRLRDHPATADAHITMVLQDGDEDARARSIRAGADDYITGALDADRLLRRLKLDSGAPAATLPQTRIALGDLQVEKAAFIARYQGRRIDLALNEYNLLLHFAEHPNRVFTRNSLIEVLGKNGATIDERTVDVWIGRLRRAFRKQGAPDPLRTVRSVGYVLDFVEGAALERAL